MGHEWMSEDIRDRGVVTGYGRSGLCFLAGFSIVLGLLVKGMHHNPWCTVAICP